MTDALARLKEENIPYLVCSYSSLDCYFRLKEPGPLYLATDSSLVALAKTFDDLQFPGLPLEDAAVQNGGNRLVFRCVDSLSLPPSAPFTVGYLGRLERQKGIAVLLDAFALLRESIPGARLRIAGSGPFPVPEDDGVRVDGWVTDRYSWFGGIHVLVAPSYPWENLGNSPIEALAHGVPAIVTASGGLPETVGRFGTVVPPGDFRSLASALQVVAGCYNDERSVALEGREWVREEFSPEKHVERLLAIYRRA